MEKNWRLKFWIPLGGGFMIVPGQPSYLDPAFYNKWWVAPLFMLWHCGWIALPFIIVGWNV